MDIDDMIAQEKERIVDEDKSIAEVNTAAVAPIQPDSSESFMRQKLFDNGTTADDMRETFKKGTILSAALNEETVAKASAVQGQSLIDEVEREAEKKRLEDEERLLQQKILTANEYYKDHTDVLRFAGINSAQNLLYMKIMFAVFVPFYTTLKILTAITKLFGEIIALIDLFCGTVFGTVKNETYDKDGNLLSKTYRMNFVTRIIIGAGLAFIGLVVVFAMINYFTGIDVVHIVRDYATK